MEAAGAASAPTRTNKELLLQPELFICKQQCLHWPLFSRLPGQQRLAMCRPAPTRPSLASTRA